MSNEEVWAVLLVVNVDGETMFGKCRVSDATACQTCACKYYFQANVIGSFGKTGWLKNSQSCDNTGCLNGRCWGGYSSSMCTGNLKADAKAMLLDALNNNACDQGPSQHYKCDGSSRAIKFQPYPVLKGRLH